MISGWISSERDFDIEEPDSAIWRSPVSSDTRDHAIVRKNLSCLNWPVRVGTRYDRSAMQYMRVVTIPRSIREYFAVI